MAPASTIAIRLSVSISILSNLSIERTIPSSVGIAPPTSPVPPPLGKTGVLFSFAIFRISDISLALAGLTRMTLAADMGLTESAVSSVR